MKNDSLKSIIVLTAISLIVAFLLSSVNLITTDVIKEAEAEKENEAFLAVLPDADSLEEITLDGDTPQSITAAMKATNGSGYAFKMIVNGYSGTPMNAIVGINNEGKIIKLSFIEYTDSPGIGSPEGFDELFRGKDNTTTDNDAGATVTTNAIKAALNDAYTVLAKVGTAKQSDKQKLALLWEKLMPSAKTPAGTFNFTEPEGPIEDTSILGVFAPSNEIGYVYLIETENKPVAVAVNAFGKAYAVYDLDGNNLTDDTAYTAAKEEAENGLPAIYTAKEKVNTRRIKNALKAKIGEEKAAEATLEAIALPTVSSSVTAAYKLKADSNEYYAFMAHTIGYGGTVKVLYILDSNGEIFLYKTTSHSESEGYGAAIADKAYSDKLSGSSLEAVTDSDILVSGATITSNAVKQAKEDIKAAFNTAKEGF